MIRLGTPNRCDISSMNSAALAAVVAVTGLTSIHFVEMKEGVVLRFFHQEFSLTWKDFSTLLGFHQCCTVDANQALIGFHKESFLEFITRTESSGGARCNDIRNSTLRLMHKWVAITSFLGRMFGLFVYMNFVFFMPWWTESSFLLLNLWFSSGLKTFVWLDPWNALRLSQGLLKVWVCWIVQNFPI